MNKPWYRPNKGQAIFGWVVGLAALLVAFDQATQEFGAPLVPALVGIVALAWALGYQRAGTEG